MGPFVRLFVVNYPLDGPATTGLCPFGHVVRRTEAIGYPMRSPMADENDARRPERLTAGGALRLVL
jgi:hypothetical protein